MPLRDDSVPNNGVDLQFVQVQVVFLLALMVEVTAVIGKGKLISQVSQWNAFLKVLAIMSSQ